MRHPLLLGLSAGGNVREVAQSTVTQIWLSYLMLGFTLIVASFTLSQIVEAPRENSFLPAGCLPCSLRGCSVFPVFLAAIASATDS
jgi:hypothetical protein